MTRKDQLGRVWGPQQRITRGEALYMFTRWSAEYLLRENRIGTIENRKLADFVVLNRDYLTVPEDEIGAIDPVLTVVGGQIVYSQPEFAKTAGLPLVGFQEKPSWWQRGTPEEATKARTRPARDSGE
ncbi:MAG: amidohydrolase family protein [Acidobacteria bacterium]|nr:amidohydrolase family protein [Acidobacteriota bacterium]